MRPFLYARAESPEAAVAQAAPSGSSPAPSHVGAPVQYLAGGTVLLDLMKLDVMRPERLVEINGLAARMPALGRVEVTPEGVRLGALVRMSEAAEHEALKRDYPVLTESLWQAASQQLRNMASLSGNVLQRTRCPYFRDVSWGNCNKREPGSGCAALEGVNRLHAVLGTSEACIASYPGDFAQALIALDAKVETLGPRGPRSLAFADLHRSYADRPHIETNLEPGELITGFTVPAGPHTRRSLYLKVRDRASYAFALASAAVALDLDGERVRDVRIGLGGVATKPWRAVEAETVLRGEVLTEANAAKAAEAAFAAARTHGHNAFKVKLGRETIVRALLEAKAKEV
jgi:xanthine dehydrogenase YagS FAD-binding subunit